MASNRSESGLEKEIRKYFQESDELDAREDELPPNWPPERVGYGSFVNSRNVSQSRTAKRRR